MLTIKCQKNIRLTYKTSILTDAISSLYLSHQKPFILMVPTMKNITPEIQQFLGKNKFRLLSMADELHLQTDGSFKPGCSIRECMKSANRSFFTTEITEDTEKYIFIHEWH